ncbi:type VII secretion AAA-ATPase EccA (plasmid) [Mycobacterium dioxanotrophicus]|jgi:type VII secretion ATPase EccA|uniref:Type VII secretion AAA-ATPase EccA n=1 Tax=Mycobacterium dioxanotrophicus TaxID=482462 RepID=A0A1Y0CGF8_9MYCO|nr:type VII secretion AAA-ATPase EccA [Mycobacterium dioxanotrophicus]ART74351.1 type VII secretion AAA-ATPase EccA [Mycobacterium dioxanotrophicus]
MSGAEEALEAGLLALGFMIDGEREPLDVSSARKVLAAATKRDPGMADAWLARLRAGDTSLGVYEGLWKARHRIGHALRGPHIRLRPEDLAVTHEAMLLRVPLTSADIATAAYVKALCQTRRFDDAVAVFAGELSAENRFTTYSAVSLYYETERWPQVLETGSLLRNHPDYVVAGATRALIGHAQTFLGLYQAAIAIADEPLPNKQRIVEVFPAARAAVAFFVGLSHRALGDEDAAAEQFRTAVIADPTYRVAQDYLDHPDMRPVTVDQAVIDSRTDPWDPATAVDPGELHRESQAADRAKMLSDAEALLAQQIGLYQVKDQVAKLQSMQRMNVLRAAKGLPPVVKTNHLAFTGPPGTGKTTIARIVAKILCGLDVVATDKVVEVSRADLVAGYLGQTATKTHKVIDSALDGVLFIDEAYTLIQEGLAEGDAFGREAVDTLLKRMDDDRDRLVVIIAGYAKDIDRFLSANEGMASRIPKRVEFPSFNPSELVDIANVIGSVTEHRMDSAARDLLLLTSQLLVENVGHDENGRERPLIDIAGNGRFIRNVVEAAIEAQSYRLMQLPDVEELHADAMGELTVADVRNALRSVLSVDGSQAANTPLVVTVAPLLADNGIGMPARPALGSAPHGRPALYAVSGDAESIS